MELDSPSLALSVSSQSLQSDLKFNAKALVVRLNKLGHLPPAYNAVRLMQKKGIPVLVYEFGDFKKNQMKVSGEIPKRRMRFWGINIFPRPLRAPLRMLLSFLYLSASFLKEGKPKVLIAQGLQEQIICWGLRKCLGVSYGVQVHEIFDSQDLTGLTKLFLRFERKALRGAEFLVFPEKTRQEIYQKRYGLENDQFVCFNTPCLIPSPSPVDLKKQLGVTEDSTLIGFIGGIGEFASLEPLICALRTLPKVHLVLWGWGEPTYLEKLKQLSSLLSITSQVHFLGVLEKDKFNHIAALDLAYCVYRPLELRTRYQATASNKLWEALACRVPVLCSDSLDFKSIIETHQVGYSIPIESEVIAHLLHHVCTKGVPESMKTNARQLHESQMYFERQFEPALNKIKSYF